MDWTIEERHRGEIREAYVSTDKKQEQLAETAGSKEIKLKWTEDKKGPDIVVEEEGAVVSRSAHYGPSYPSLTATACKNEFDTLSFSFNSVPVFWHAGWGTQLADTWFRKGDGVFLIELLCENMDDLGFFVGVMDEKFTKDGECGDWDEQVRDIEHFLGMHAEGRLFLRTKEKDRGLMRLDTGRVITLTLDMNRLTLNIELRGGVSGAEIPKIPSPCTLAVCFGGKQQRVRIASCIHQDTL